MMLSAYSRDSSSDVLDSAIFLFLFFYKITAEQVFAKLAATYSSIPKPEPTRIAGGESLVG